MRRPYRRFGQVVTIIILACAALAWASAPALAQQPSRAEIEAKVDALLKEKWDRALAATAQQLGLTLQEGRLSGTREQKVKAYTQVLDQVAQDKDLLTFVPQVFSQAYVKELINQRVESRMPTSLNATSTNPATAGLAERSGSTSLAALVADFSNIVSADKTAVSINLSALAFVSLSDEKVYSELANYQRHDLARRLTGTLVVGAKIPEKEITGLSSLPDFDTLLDAMAWDVKFRVWGDKDPRSKRWYDLTVRDGGFLTQKSAVLLGLIGGAAPEKAIEDLQIVRELLDGALGKAVSDMKTRIARSPQLSIKAAGTHLTKETGKNRYAFAALFDVGVGPSDITANAQYAVTDDIRLGVDQVFKTKIWTLSGQITSHLAPDVIAPGRTVDWNVGASAALFQDAKSLPVKADNTWKVFTSFEFPIKAGGKIPVSIIYSNDPNAIGKQNYVRGQIGVSYDFSALTKLFAPGS